MICLPRSALGASDLREFIVWIRSCLLRAGREWEVEDRVVGGEMGVDDRIEVAEMAGL